MESLSQNVFHSKEKMDKYFEFSNKKVKEWPVPSETRYVKTSYGETYVRESEQNNSEIMILMHGSGNNSLT